MDGVVVTGFKPQNPQTFKQSSGGWKWTASGPLVEDSRNIWGHLIIISFHFSSGCRCRIAQRFLSLWDWLCALEHVSFTFLHTAFSEEPLHLLGSISLVVPSSVTKNKHTQRFNIILTDSRCAVTSLKYRRHIKRPADPDRWLDVSVVPCRLTCYSWLTRCGSDWPDSNKTLTSGISAPGGILLRKCTITDSAHLYRIDRCDWRPWAKGDLAF